MIQNSTDYKIAMREMIRKVQRAGFFETRPNYTEIEHRSYVLYFCGGDCALLSCRIAAIQP